MKKFRNSFVLAVIIELFRPALWTLLVIGDGGLVAPDNPARSSNKTLHTESCAWRIAQSAEHAVTRVGPDHHHITYFIRPPGTVVPGGLMFYCWCFCYLFVALCGAISPSSLDRSSWNFQTRLEVCNKPTKHAIHYVSVINPSIKICFIMRRP